MRKQRRNLVHHPARLTKAREGPKIGAGETVTLPFIFYGLQFAPYEAIGLLSAKIRTYIAMLCVASAPPKSGGSGGFELIASHRMQGDRNWQYQSRPESQVWKGEKRSVHDYDKIVSGEWKWLIFIGLSRAYKSRFWLVACTCQGVRIGRNLHDETPRDSPLP